MLIDCMQESGVLCSKLHALFIMSGQMLYNIMTAMQSEQIGSAMFQCKYWIINEDTITPTDPSVSAKMCKNIPVFRIKRCWGCHLTMHQITVVYGSIMMMCVLSMRPSIMMTSVIVMPMIKCKNANNVYEEAQNRHQQQLICFHFRWIPKTKQWLNDDIHASKQQGHATDESSHNLQPSISIDWCLYEFLCMNNPENRLKMTVNEIKWTWNDKSVLASPHEFNLKNAYSHRMNSLMDAHSHRMKPS